MAVFETVRPAPLGAVTIHRAVVRTEGFLQAVRSWDRSRRTLAALRKLTPAQLSDIGLEGVDLEEFAENLRRR